MCLPFLKQFWKKQYKGWLAAALVLTSPLMTVCAEETPLTQESAQIEEEQTPLSSYVEELLPAEELTQTVTAAGEELVDQIGEEVKEKAKEVKHNVLLNLWEHIKQMFRDFFAAFLGEKE